MFFFHFLDVFVVMIVRTLRIEGFFWRVCRP